MYNRYAESSRVKWVRSFADRASPALRQQWLDIMSPRGVGFILKSIKTDFKLPITYPDTITVMHKLAQRPTHDSHSIFLEAVILSETHRRVAARCVEEIVVYDYTAGKKTALPGFMVEELQKVYEMQVRSREEVEKRIEALEQLVQGTEAGGDTKPS